MAKQTHPQQGAQQGLNTPPRRYADATVFRGDKAVHELKGGVTQFQILPNGLAIQIFREDGGDEYTICINSDTAVRVAEGVIEPASITPA